MSIAVNSETFYKTQGLSSSRRKKVKSNLNTTNVTSKSIKYIGCSLLLTIVIRATMSVDEQASL